MGNIGMCRCEGYGFQAVYSKIGYINQTVWIQNRVLFFKKLISWLKILSRLGKQLLQNRGDLGVYSSIGQQNSAELALVQVKGSRVPAAHPHPEIPKVPPPGSSPTGRFASGATTPVFDIPWKFLLKKTIFKNILQIPINASGQISDCCCSCLLYTSPSPRDGLLSRMPSSA